MNINQTHPILNGGKKFRQKFKIEPKIYGLKFISLQPKTENVIITLHSHSFQPTQNCLKNSQTEMYLFRINDSILSALWNQKALFKSCVIIVLTSALAAVMNCQQTDREELLLTLLWANSAFRVFIFPFFQRLKCQLLRLLYALCSMNTWHLAN